MIRISTVIVTPVIAFATIDVIPHTVTDAKVSIKMLLAGDLNSDGAVNIVDIVMVAIKYRQTGTPGCTVEDTNNDG
jgi:hypothetical protein